MSIRWDGRVVPCCRDYDNHEILGDITKETLMDIWNGKRFQALRRDHLEGEYDNSVLCSKCVEWSKYRMPEPGSLMQAHFAGDENHMKVLLVNPKYPEDDIVKRRFIPPIELGYIASLAMQTAMK